MTKQTFIEALNKYQAAITLFSALMITGSVLANSSDYISSSLGYVYLSSSFFFAIWCLICAYRDTLDYGLKWKLLDWVQSTIKWGTIICISVNTITWVVIFPVLIKYYYGNIKILEYWLNNSYILLSFKLSLFKLNEGILANLVSICFVLGYRLVKSLKNLPKIAKIIS